MSISEKLAELNTVGKVLFPFGLDMSDFEFAATIRNIRFTKSRVETNTRTYISYRKVK